MRRKPSVSIIVPTLNEVDNIPTLIARIDAVLADKAVYEIIFIDDHSTDGTVGVIQATATRRPVHSAISVHSKIGRPGKAYSLLEGFQQAQLELICIIDGDLQYPPEAIPRMITALDGHDVIVADREAVGASVLRHALSRVGRKLYGEWLYGLDCDVQSGLKLFRKSVLERMVHNSTRWTFDLSFLVQARDNGHKIGSIPIPFAKRQAGHSKVNVLRVGTEIVVEAIKFKLSKRPLLEYTESITAGEEAS